MARLLKWGAFAGLYGVGVWSGVTLWKINRPEVFDVSNQEREEKWRKLAPTYDQDIDFSEGLSGINSLRKELVGNARGNVLEIAAGTGRNVQYYPRNCTVLLTDRSSEMVEVLQSKVKKTGLQAHMSTRQAVAEQLAAEETAVFDTIVDTFGLCSVDDPVGVLQGCARLLKDDGTVLLLEHGRGDWPLVNKLLDARASAHAREWGCWYNKDIPAIVKRSGLTVVTHKTVHFGTTHYYVLRK